MAEKIGTTLVVSHTPPETCEDCGVVNELRPYGPGGKKICTSCAMKDLEGTRLRMAAILRKQMEGVTHVVVDEGIVGDKGAVLRRSHFHEDLMKMKARHSPGKP